LRRNLLLPVLLAAAVVLIAAAWLRSAEYDEQYTLFLTAGVARPVWPDHVFTAATVQALQARQASFSIIASELRTTDVHPPLYFWLIHVWRELLGPGLFAARLASVLCSVVTLGLVALIARRTGIPVVPAVLFTLGCYGFAYTGTIARGFALAQMLNVAGIALLLAAQGRWHRLLAAGLLLGAATFTNYLAVFVGCAVLLHRFITGIKPLRPLLISLIGFALWLPADIWFFQAQRESRVGQFVPFEPVLAAARLAFYSGANLFGGLPLYLHGNASSVVTVTLAIAMVVLLMRVIQHCGCISNLETRRLLAMTAIATPVGLMVLGAVFRTTPIELRYLAFATPYVGLLLAGTLRYRTRNAVLAVQALALIGLMVRPETMQPARPTALAAAAWADDGVVLVPHGNDGVGIVGAFGIEAPPQLRLLVVGRDEQPADIRRRAGSFSRVVLALISQDAASRAALPRMRRAFTDPCWRAVGHGFNVLAFDRLCGEGVSTLPTQGVNRRGLAQPNPYCLDDQIGLTQTSGWADAWMSKPGVYGIAAWGNSASWCRTRTRMFPKAISSSATGSMRATIQTGCFSCTTASAPRAGAPMGSCEGPEMTGRHL
jgi:hypothetical protein